MNKIANKELDYSKEEAQLGAKRTYLSGVRTFLSHIRTALVLLSVAFAFMKLDKEHPVDAFTICLFVFSGIFLIVGTIDFIITKNMIHEVKEKRD